MLGVALSQCALCARYNEAFVENGKLFIVSRISLHVDLPKD